MNVLKPRQRWCMEIALMVMLAWTLAGCASNQSGSPPPSPFGQQSQSGGAQPQQASSQPQPPPPSSSPPPATQAQRPMFYDFQDIPVPAELELQSGDSYVFQSAALKAGMLTFRGRVETGSLTNFFQMALPRENWKMKGGFRYRRTVLIFEKPDKTCVIQIYEKMFYTYAEIYVVPAGGQL